MKYTCPLCELDPLCHSLKKIADKQGIIYFYTCPSQAKMYYDTEGIVNHYQGVLSEIPADKEWVWIFDSVDFGLKHAMQFSVAKELSTLIGRFSTNLKQIIIINPTFYTSITYNMLMPFLSSKVVNIIEMNNALHSGEEVVYGIL